MGRWPTCRRRCCTPRPGGSAASACIPWRCRWCRVRGRGKHTQAWPPDAGLQREGSLCPGKKHSQATIIHCCACFLVTRARRADRPVQAERRGGHRRAAGQAVGGALLQRQAGRRPRRWVPPPNQLVRLLWVGAALYRRLCLAELCPSTASRRSLHRRPASLVSQPSSSALCPL